MAKSVPRIKLRAGASPDVAAIFRELVASVDAEHWRPADTHLLEQYAQSIALARQAYAALESEGSIIQGKVNPNLLLLEKAHRSSVALSMRLRLSPQSRIDPKTAGRASRTAGGKKLGRRLMPTLEQLLADFRAADSAMWKIIHETPAGEPGRLAFEAALRAVVEAGERLAEARRPRLVTDGGAHV